MKRFKKLISYTLYTLLVVVLFSCKAETKQKTDKVIKKETYKNNTEIVKIRNCEYVLWHNGYGSDMEHYEGCKNAEHYN